MKILMTRDGYGPPTPKVSKFRNFFTQENATPIINIDECVAEAFAADLAVYRTWAETHATAGKWNIIEEDCHETDADGYVTTKKWFLHLYDEKDADLYLKHHGTLNTTIV